MARIKLRLTLRSAALLLALLITLPAFADDTEIFRSTAASAGAQPNVLFIMDTSGSMDSLVTSPRPPYDPTQTYTGSCDSANIYYISGSGVPSSPPTCRAAGNFPATSNNCSAMTRPSLPAPGITRTWLPSSVATVRIAAGKR
jgi:hypothetical protein